LTDKSSSNFKIIGEHLTPKHSSTGAIHWGLQRITGFLLIFLVGAHLLFEHFIETETGPASFQSVTERLQDPVYFLVDMLLLLTALYHALNGTRTVLLDLALPPKLQTMITYLLIIIGMLATIYGIWLLIEIR
jgi:succinate dehydrogenase cytochrome b556 subunit